MITRGTQAETQIQILSPKPAFLISMPNIQLRLRCQFYLHSQKIFSSDLELNRQFFFFSFSTLKMLLHCFLASIISAKAMIAQIVVPLCMFSFFEKVVAIKIVSSSSFNLSLISLWRFNYLLLLLLLLCYCSTGT